MNKIHTKVSRGKAERIWKEGKAERERERREGRQSETSGKLREEGSTEK